MKIKLFLALLLIVLGTGFTATKSPRSFEVSVFQYGDNPLSVNVLDDPSQLYESIEQVEPGKFIVHFDPISCLYRNGFVVSNMGNIVDFPIERNLALGYWVCGQAVLTATDMQGNFTNGFMGYVRITIYPNSPISP